MRRVIIYREEENIEVFSSLKKLMEKYPLLSEKKSQIENCLSRKQKPYISDDIVIFRAIIQ